MRCRPFADLAQSARNRAVDRAKGSDVPKDLADLALGDEFCAVGVREGSDALGALLIGQ